MPPIVVTGASGYLGAHVMKLLQAQGKPVVGVSRSDRYQVCDFCDAQEVMALVQDIRPDIIIHCAAIVPKMDGEYGDDEIGNLNLSMVENISVCPVRHVVFASSMTVYDATMSMPVLESDALPPSGGYGGGKRRAECLLKKSKFQSTILRFPGLFGGGRKSGLLYNVARAFDKAEVPLLPASPPLWGGLHVHDAAQICVAATERKDTVRSLVVNAGYPDEQAVHLAVALLAQRFDLPVPEMVEGPVFAMNVDRLQKEFGLPDRTWSKRLDELVTLVKEERFNYA